LEQERLEKERLEQERLDMLKKESQIKDDEQERLNQERLEQKRLDKIKYKQQRKNLKRRKENYEERTGEKYHPLVTDNEDKNDNILIPQDNAPPTTLNSLPTTSQQIPLPIVSPPKLVPTNKKTRKKIKTPKTPPVYEGIEMTDFNKPKISVKNKTRKIQNLGFTETLRQPNANNQQNPKPLPNSTICQNIFINGSKTNNKYFYPSEFPKLTKIKPITVLTKKGGKNYKRKTFKKKYKNKNKY
jgi:hypothetical protein